MAVAAVKVDSYRSNSGIPTLYIRADADSKIGMGHVMRSMSIARAWRQEGGVTYFITDCRHRPLLDRIRNEGINLVQLKASKTDAADLRMSLEWIHTATEPGRDDWVVLDGYHFTGDYQKSVIDAGFSLLVIDDINHLPNYHAHILLNQNINAPLLEYRCDPKTVLLLGSQYVLMQPEFHIWASQRRDIVKYPKIILITMGGGDPNGITEKALMAINRLNDPSIEVSVVVGAFKKNLPDIPVAFKCRFYHDVDNMARLMARADMAITAAGSTCWELAYMGIPSITIAASENQKSVAQKLDDLGIFETLGWWEMIGEDEFVSEIASLISNHEKRRYMSERASALVDGKGTQRVLEHMLNHQKKSESDADNGAIQRPR